MTTTATGLDARHANRAGWLHLAAAPTFAVMALLNALTASPADVLCSAGHGMSSLGGMTLMYALMGVFHAGPWWKLVAARRDRRQRHVVGLLPEQVPGSTQPTKASCRLRAFAGWR